MVEILVVGDGSGWFGLLVQETVCLRFGVGYQEGVRGCTDWIYISREAVGFL